MMYLQLDGCTVAGARVVTGDTEDEGRGVVLQITTHIFRMMYLQLDGCTVAGARVVTGDTEDEGRGVVLQITPTSSV